MVKEIGQVGCRVLQNGVCPEVSKLCLGCDFWCPQLWGVTPSQGVLGAVTPPGIKEQKSCLGMGTEFWKLPGLGDLETRT